ncbi:MAG: hypothetical protein ACI85O_003162, partial [Saprospiraceae bacterium]
WTLVGCMKVGQLLADSQYLQVLLLQVPGADASGIHNGSDNPAPGYPGEDFIINAPTGLTFPTELAETPIVISIEPVPDNSAAPFTLKPLIKVTPAAPSIGMPYDLDNKSADLPTGTVSRVIQ